MAPTDPHCTIGPKTNAKAVHITSLVKCLRRYGANTETKILVGTVLAVEIGTKATALGRIRTLFVTRFDLGGGSMKVATINIRSVKIHTPEPPRPSTGGNDGDRATAATTTTIRDTTVTNPVYVQVLRRQRQIL